MRSLANSEDPYEMPHDAALHQGLLCLLIIAITLFDERNIFFVEIITCGPSVYTMDHPKFIALNQKEERIRA